MNSIFLRKPNRTAQTFLINHKAKWHWTAVRDCPDKLLNMLNDTDAPRLHFTKSSAAPAPWNGFWGMEELKYDDWRYDLQLEYGMGDETSIMLTFEGRQGGDPTPKIIPVVTASRV